MTPKEIQTALDELRREVGSKADVSMFLQDRLREHPIYASIHAGGIGTSREDGYLSIEADTFEEALEKLRAAWAGYSTEHRAKAVRKMALAIITITSEQGRCSDAALRGAGFPEGDIRKFGADACAEANAMATKGPFTIVMVTGANGAPGSGDEIGATVN